MPKGAKYGGRTKGTPNKVTASIKSAFKEAFDELGGTEALVAWAKTNPDDFYKLSTKLIPTEIANADDKPFKLDISTSDQEIIDRALAAKK